MPQFTGNTDTGGQFRHSHAYDIDEDGKGRTTSTVGQGNPHTHIITRFRVELAGFGPHDHKIPQSEIDKIKSSQ